MPNAECPCLSGQIYLTCCGPYHQKQAIAPTAEGLMRSRYTAFVMQLSGYLQDTHHVSTRPSESSEESYINLAETPWLGLTLLDIEQQDDSATVEFVAFYKDQPIGQLHERSRFIKEHGSWFYLDGQFLAAIALAKKSACFCGSGKKLKHCHG